MRTPRNFDGISSTNKPIGPLLDELLSQVRKQVGFHGHEVVASWEEILGPQFASLTKAVGVQDGVLTVKVKSSTLYSLLHQHERVRLLARLQEKFPQAGLKDIVFRVGRFT